MAYFAQLDANNIVLTVIVADQSFIDILNNPESWVPTAPPNYAGIGYTYDPVSDVFLPPQVDAPPPQQGATGATGA